MNLHTVHITEFQSTRDSNEFTIGDITCLVGKNEAGKTALLQALYRLNPIEGDGSFSVTHDYPRSNVSEYEQAVANGTREHAVVVRAVFELSPEDTAAVEASVGDGVLTGSTLTLEKGYQNELFFELSVDENQAIRNAISNASLLPELKEKLEVSENVATAKSILDGAEQTEAVLSVKATIDKFAAHDSVSNFIFTQVLTDRVPKFLYFDEYYQMKGRENIEGLKSRKAEAKLVPSDHPLLGLIHLASLEIDDLLEVKETRELKNKLEGAGNNLTRNVVKYWSQNRHLALRFDVRPAAPNDPPGMTTGTNIWADVYDSRHEVTTELGTRSRGFVWFFSFLAWYFDVKHGEHPVIFLLDEPGLSLHAKAQEDLLKYFDAEIAGHQQLIYTTHSPFMVDPARFDRVRIVQDLGIDSNAPLPPEQEGTKVFTEVLDATGDSLFPLQGALGYEIYQTLFIGPNSLVVEGVSDLLYLQSVSAVLEAKGRVGLSKAWTITPVGGAGKVPTFVALIGAQKGLKVAVLIDYQKKDHQQIEDLFKRKLLKKNNVLTFAEFTGGSEADIEDMFDVDFYLGLVNAEYENDLKSPIKVSDLDAGLPRIVPKLEKYFAENNLGSFNHFRPARLFAEESAERGGELSDDTLNRFEKAAERINALLPGGA